ncbi:unnamed protein product [Ilex paraguariensis]|uniref:Expansin-like EG45 domain-containing protein n=1 Tax=Ilex paraguariensis TaxID=185542 RepID=A0ABC8S3B4_9AQUA
MAIERLIIVAFIVTTLFSMTFAVPGIATYYTASACFGFEDRGTMMAAASQDLYANGAACGRRYSVACTSGTHADPNLCRNGNVTVTVVDLCPSCPLSGLDLSLEAFSTIADPAAGKINIDYTR